MFFFAGRFLQDQPVPAGPDCASGSLAGIVMVCCLFCIADDKLGCCMQVLHLLPLCLPDALLVDHHLLFDWSLLPGYGCRQLLGCWGPPPGVADGWVHHCQR